MYSMESVPSTSGSSFGTDMPQETKNNSWRQTCLKLSTIFPNVDPEIIKKKYFEIFSDENLPDEEDVFQVAINVLKNEEKNTGSNISLGDSAREISVDEQISNLKSLFPDANPLYLKSIASKSSGDPGALEKFVEDKFETRDYPTRDFYVPAKNKKGIQPKEYVDSFNMEEYLKMVPNPIKIFENVERKCNYDVTMFELMKNHFDRLKISTISSIYTRKSFNAVLAFESMQAMKPELDKKRKKAKVDTEKSPASLEFDYIKNKNRIKNYFEQKEEREEKLLQKMKNNNELLECECCFEELFATSTIATCYEGHVFCKTCMQKAAKVELESGGFRIFCFTGCTSEFSLNSLQKVLEPAQFKILLQKIQEAEIMAAKIEGLVSCPFCHFASIPPKKEQIFKCLSPDCGRESCRLCRKPNHFPKECEILEKSKKARLILEEQMTLALVRKCGNCGKKFIKDGGCNVMTCSCGSKTCYSCGQLSISHAHLQGRCNAGINDAVDARGVIYVAKKVERELLKLDPNLKIDADSLLSSFPEASRIRTDNIETVDLTAHALRASSIIPQL